jgi:hypothetical protein
MPKYKYIIAMPDDVEDIIGVVDVPDDEKEPETWIADWIDVELHDLFPSSWKKEEE